MRNLNKVVTLLFFVTYFVIGQQRINQKPGITIKDAWIRIGAQGSNTALFFEVVNNSNVSDTLLNVESDLAEVVEVHETFKRENDMMGMRKVKFVVIPPKSKVQFKPRDLHVMLINLKKDLKMKDKSIATIVFKKAGKIKVEGIVQDMPRMNN